MKTQTINPLSHHVQIQKLIISMFDQLLRSYDSYDQVESLFDLIVFILFLFFV